MEPKYKNWEFKNLGSRPGSQDEVNINKIAMLQVDKKT